VAHRVKGHPFSGVRKGVLGLAAEKRKLEILQFYLQGTKGVFYYILGKQWRKLKSK